MGESLERLSRCGVVPAVVLEKAEDAVPMANALLKGGVDVMKITFLLSDIMTEGTSLEEASNKLLNDMLDYCKGKLTTAEVLGDTEIAVTRIGYTV